MTASPTRRTVKADEMRAFLRKNGGRILLALIISFILIEFVFVFLYPFLNIIINSLKYDFELKDMNRQWVITGINGQNYVDAFKHLDYLHALGNTLAVVLLSTAGHLLSCSFIAYGFARFAFRGRNVLFALVMLTMVIPPQTLMMPLYIQFARMGWLGSFAPIIVPSFFGFGLKGALFIFLFRQQIRGLPLSYEEAAKLEGCGSMRIFWRIIFPLLKGNLLVAGILSVIWHWNDYFEPSAYLSGNLRILTQRLSSLNAYFATQTTGTGQMVSPVQLAACMLVILPLLVMYFVFQRRFIKSIDLTGLAN